LLTQSTATLNPFFVRAQSVTVIRPLGADELAVTPARDGLVPYKTPSPALAGFALVAGWVFKYLAVSDLSIRVISSRCTASAVCAQQVLR